MTYTGVLATILTGIEPAVALSLSCVPFLRPLIKGRSMDTTANTSGDNSDLRTFGASSNSRKTNRSDFKELDSHNDNSSEVQLHPMDPMGNKGVSSAEVGHDDLDRGQTPAVGDGGEFIVVKNSWHVVSGK